MQTKLIALTTIFGITLTYLLLPMQPFWLIQIIKVLLVSILIMPVLTTPFHECGHAFAALVFRIPLKCIKIGEKNFLIHRNMLNGLDLIIGLPPWGGEVKEDTASWQKVYQFQIYAAAGVMANLAIGAIVLAIIYVTSPRNLFFGYAFLLAQIYSLVQLVPNCPGKLSSADFKPSDGWLLCRANAVRYLRFHGAKV